jgi:DNA polymerase III epsilon subunit-like protein
MQKEFWFDTETTGLDPNVNEITQISGEMCGERFNIFCKPNSPISPGSLEVQGVTVDEVMAYPPSTRGFEELIALFDKHIDKFDTSDRMTPIAFNANFDIDMLYSFFKRHTRPKPNSKFMEHSVGSYLRTPAVCVMYAYRWLVFLGRLPEPSKDAIKGKRYSLEQICKLHGIVFKPHDALADIVATQELYRKVILPKI